MIKRFTIFCSFLLASLTAAAQSPAPCSELFFSQYVEGTGHNKALEIYNPTNGVVDMSQYRVLISFNGGTTTKFIDLVGTLDPATTFLVVHDSAVADLLLLASQSSTDLEFNGNDAVALIKTTALDTLDVIGILGENPGPDGWFVGGSGATTTDQTLIRTSNVLNGTMDWNGEGAMNWAELPGGANVFFDLGMHAIDPCGGTPDPELSFPASSQQLTESASATIVYVNITYPNVNPTSVTVVDLGGTATQGVDYSVTTTSVTFPSASGVAQEVVVNLFPDGLTETNEYFVLKLENPTNNATFGVQYDTIYINDASAGTGPILQLHPIDPDTILENAATNVVITQVNIGPPSTDTTKVTIAVLPQSTATLGVDFDMLVANTVLTFPPNSDAPIPYVITITDDLLYEGDETIVLSLTNPTNDATIDPAWDTLTLTIIDNDPVAIHELQTLGINAWPNPVYKRCTVTTTEVTKAVNVYNTAGQLVYTANPMDNRFAIEAEGFAPGLYVVEAVTANTTLRYRLTKQQ